MENKMINFDKDLGYIQNNKAHAYHDIMSITSIMNNASKISHIICNITIWIDKPNKKEQDILTYYTSISDVHKTL